ncbi:MAG: hypothetical protein GX086_01040 [Alcaligenaceae bacterium]|nr:hypothetical protein [Alcaligenaceae bacterium]
MSTDKIRPCRARNPTPNNSSGSPNTKPTCAWRGGGVWPIEVDAGQLESAILNLGINARDAMPDGGKLTIETANAHLDDNYASQHHEVTAGQYVMISVSDTGSGMPPEVANRAFDPFYTTKPVGKGSGVNGRQLAEQALALCPTLKILYTSGYTENAIVHHGRLDRGVNLLSKPYRRNELANKVRKVLDETG